MRNILDKISELRAKMALWWAEQQRPLNEQEQRDNLNDQI